MPSDSARAISSEAAQKAQQRFEFYFVALAFTILGLAVQTAPDTTVQWIPYVEITGWLCLLLAALLGMSRLEWMPNIYNLHSMQFSEEERAQGFREAQLKGSRTMYVLDEMKEKPIEALLTTTTTNLERIAERLGQLERRGFWKYRIQKFAFLAGLLLLIVARGAHLVTTSAELAGGVEVNATQHGG